MGITIGLVYVLSLWVLIGGVKDESSQFRWRRSRSAMPWLKGPNVCAVEEVTGSRKRFYTECMSYKPRTVCGKPTFIRYHCCTGYEVDDDTKGCQGVKPVENLANTAKHLYLKEFRKYAKNNDVVSDRLVHGGAYTVFVPENKAFTRLPPGIKREDLENTDVDKNLLSYHMADGRYYISDLTNDVNLPSLYANNATIKINRYSNGVTTANCARIVLPNQPATNGILHVIEKVIAPIDKSVDSAIEKILFHPNLGEFVTALVLTDLANHLRGSTGSYTIFAPTDEAFRNAPQDLINRVLKDNKLVEKLLKYHILDKEICSAAIMGPTTLTTLEGQQLNLSCDVLDRLTVNGVPVADSDVAYNGVIHYIDTLLIPDSVKTVEDKLEDLGLFEFMEYAQAAGLSNILKQSSENYTILAPNSDAFKNLTSERKRLLSSSAEAAKRVLNYHVIPGYITTRNMVGETSFDTFGSTSTLNAHSNAKVYSQTFGMNSARIVNKDNAVANGIVHIIDEVLWPPENLMFEKLQEDPQYKTFLSLLQQSGLARMLRSEGEHYTIFAPTNDAFDAMETTVLEELRGDPVRLEIFLKNHMIHSPVYLRTLDEKWRYRFKSMADEWIELKRKSHDEPVIIGGEVNVVESDIHAINGVIHKVDNVFSCSCLDEVKDEVPLF